MPTSSKLQERVRRPIPDVDFFRVPIKSGLPNQRLSVSLDGFPLVLDLRWSMREERWYMDVRRPDGAKVAMSVKIVCRRALLSHVPRHRNDTVHGADGKPTTRSTRVLPAGDLHVLADRDPGLDELGGDGFDLLYIRHADMAAIIAGPT